MTRLLLVTANVGSIFENDTLMTQWISHLAQNVTKEEPQFVALHCQEVGGKHEPRVSTDRFLRSLLQSLPQFSSSLVFFDADINDFTALGSIYLSRNELKANIWNFSEKIFVEANNRFSYKQQFVEKTKFPISVTKEAKKARKGFMRTRWRVCGLTLDLLNIHLFHDACNLRASSQFPSEFARIRRAALEWTLDRVYDPQIPLFLFGDFNFRVDARAFIEQFAEGRQDTRDNDQLVIHDSENQLILRVLKKSFEFRDKDLFQEKWQSLRSLDKELQPFSDRIFELPIAFPPSYPFGEDLNCGHKYMTTRCPAWCDRILFTKNARNLLLEEESHYWSLGSNQPMGDHKPVALLARLSGHISRYVRTRGGQLFRETCF